MKASSYSASEAGWAAAAAAGAAAAGPWSATLLTRLFWYGLPLASTMGALFLLREKQSFCRCPFFLQYLQAVSGVPQDGVGAGLVVAIGASLLEAERSNLIKSFIIVGIPDDLFGHILAKFMFDSGEFVQPLLVVQDGLQVAGGLDAFYVGGLLISSTLSRRPSLSPARKSWCLIKRKASVIPSAFISASVAPAAMLTRTAAMAAGFLSVRRL